MAGEMRPPPRVERHTPRPDEPQYQAVRSQPGSHIYAPGFTMYYKNSVSTVAGPIGLMAAEAITCDNEMEVTVYGSIRAYGDAGIHLHDDTTIVVDRTEESGSEFSGGEVVLVPGSYAERITSP